MLDELLERWGVWRRRGRAGRGRGKQRRRRTQVQRGAARKPAPNEALEKGDAGVSSPSNMDELLEAVDAKRLEKQPIEPEKNMIRCAKSGSANDEVGLALNDGSIRG